MFTIVQRALYYRFMFELKEVWVSFSKLCQGTQPSQVKTPNWKKKSVHLALYVHTYPCTHTLSTQTHAYTYKLQIPATFTVQPSQKRPQSTLRCHPGSTPPAFLTVRLPCDSSYSTSSCGNCNGRFITLDTILWGVSKFPPTPSADRVDKLSQGLSHVAASHIVCPDLLYINSKYHTCLYSKKEVIYSASLLILNETNLLYQENVLRQSPQCWIYSVIMWRCLWLWGVVKGSETLTVNRSNQNTKTNNQLIQLASIACVSKAW